MAKKLESNFKNMFLVLLSVTLVAGIALSLAYNATKEPIAKAKETKKSHAIEEVIQGFTDLEEETVKDVSGHEMTVYTCLKNGEVIGKAIQSYSMNGFGGEINVMVGFLPDGTLTKTVLLQHAETPGLGDKMDPAKSDFSKQFWDKKATDLQNNGVISVSKDGGKIDAITAATISSRAFCDAINRAYTVFVGGGASKDDIQNEAINKKLTLLKLVMPEFETVEEKTVQDETGKDVIVFTFLSKGTTIGKAIQSYSLKGHNGRIDILVGFFPDGTITSTAIVDQHETPGYGDKMDASVSDFPKQFWGKKVADLQNDGLINVTKDGGKIDAISGATNSSRAFCDAVQRAYIIFEKDK